MSVLGRGAAGLVGFARDGDGQHGASVQPCSQYADDFVPQRPILPEAQYELIAEVLYNCTKLHRKPLSFARLNSTSLGNQSRSQIMLLTTSLIQKHPVLFASLCCFCFIDSFSRECWSRLETFLNSRCRSECPGLYRASHPRCVVEPAGARQAVAFITRKNRWIAPPHLLTQALPSPRCGASPGHSVRSSLLSDRRA